MIAFLTSTFGGSRKVGGVRYPAPLMSENRFPENLKKYWKADSNILIIGTASDCFARNDEIKNTYAEAFPLSGFSIGEIVTCDSRNTDILNNIGQFDVVFLTGGSVPAQNAFFHQIKLKERLRTFNGILISASAGMMNCAEMVYALPEAEGEAVDPDYRRFLPGLGITPLMTIPHFQEVRNDIVDGLRAMEDMAYPDSVGREFYALSDGSYFIIENGITTLYGEAHLIKDGTIRRICEANRTLQL